METEIIYSPSRQAEEIPSLLSTVQSRVVGFDVIHTPSSENSISQVPENRSATENLTPEHSKFYHHERTTSISMPSSPSMLYLQEQGTNPSIPNGTPPISYFGLPPRKSNEEKFDPNKKARFHSHPMGSNQKSSNTVEGFDGLATQHKLRRSDGLRDNRYDPFKTWSGKLERQISNLRRKPLELPENVYSETPQTARVPKVDRFFDALEGPELDRLKEFEELVLPEDKKWPFLLRFPVSTFGICLGMSSQAILWKTLATSPPVEFLHVPLLVNLVLWCISISVLAIMAVIYLFKIIFYFEAVRREYHHPIRVNFFFAPWIACLFLAIGLPPGIAQNLPQFLWYILMTPFLCLELKIYGQWMSGGQRRLSKVANSTNHLSVVGNFVGALLGASMGLKEGPLFFYAVGMAHYIVLFVTLYQRLPTNETLPKELHPVFFLFVAAPSVACMAWAKISGEFGFGSRIAYFIALFLYASLAVRINFFRGFRFSLTWWAYTFPMTGAAIATVRYCIEVSTVFTKSLSVVLSLISTLIVAVLLVSTMIHAWVLQDLFPNDISIAITHHLPKSRTQDVDVTDVELGDSEESK
ncbi:S-type anion channel SLAH2-like protein [Carex littledalei]|uniref:S-type anion channel SLAH2-like protein n=1 Tax=Carex littledalei TaxID=544730 RepID=A0A833QLF8_9POAL|nr:S-type anion channel SLAH2-like protein [Carex littledalei]